MNERNFFSELKRRNVYKVAVNDQSEVGSKNEKG
jgi:hypothetical protein